MEKLYIQGKVINDDKEKVEKEKYEKHYFNLKRIYKFKSMNNRSECGYHYI